MVTFILLFKPMKGQGQVKLGQIKSFLSKTCLSRPVLSHDSKKMSFVPTYYNDKCKKCVSKTWPHHLTWFFGHYTAKNKDTAWKLCRHAVCWYTASIHLFRIFLINSKFWILQEFVFFFEKLKFRYLGIKIEKFHSGDSYEPQNFAFFTQICGIWRR